MGIWKRVNSKFFYKVFAMITVIILVCSLTISIALYYRFDSIMSKQNSDFIRYTSAQAKGDIINLTRKCEWIAGNIYSDTSIGTLLQKNYYKGFDYSLFVMYNSLSSSFQALEDNNPEISSITIYKLDPNLIINGNAMRDVKKFKHQDLIKRAINAKGNNVWATYRDDNGINRFCMLKFLNIYSPGGILVIEFNENSFFNLYKTGIGKKNNLFLVDENQRIISSNRREKIGMNITKLIKGYTSEDAVSKGVYFNQKPYFFYSDRVNTEWHIIMLYDSYEIQKEKRHMEYYALILTGVFILIGLVFSLLLASGFASMVDKLMIKIKEIQRGNLKIEPDKGRENEFHQLDRTLCTMAHSIENLNEEIMKAVKQKEESEIKYLQMQMNPHFLYNQLSMIRWIAYQNKQEAIMHIVDNLGNFYKIALSKGNEVIDLSSEVDLIKSYIELQNLCCDNTIHLNISVEKQLSNMKISKMTLQPFVENSVIHGRVFGRDLNILIKVIKDNDTTVKIIIEDDGTGITEEVAEYIESLNEKGLATHGRHYGITNTVNRLRLLYDGGVTIHTAAKEQGTEIELIINNVKQN